MKYFYKNEIFFHLGVDGVVLSGDPGHGFLQHGNVVIRAGRGRGGTLQVQILIRETRVLTAEVTDQVQPIRADYLEDVDQ